MPTSIRLDYLGHKRAQRGQAVMQHQVYVYWMPADGDLLASLLSVASAGAITCPECGTAWDVLRRGGLVFKLSEHRAGTIRSISDACRHCPTIVHWDNTAPEAHPRLRWIHLYDRHESVMGDRPARHGAPCLEGSVR